MSPSPHQHPSYHSHIHTAPKFSIYSFSSHPSSSSTPTMEKKTSKNQDENQNPSPIPSPKPVPTTINGAHIPQNNLQPTTFVQADASSFKQVVQMLTGSSSESSASKQHPNHKNPHPIPPKGQGFKLYERRNSSRVLKISPLLPKLNSSSIKQEILSPSMLDFPSLLLSPVTPLMMDPFHRIGPKSNDSEEEKANAEKGFYLHDPSPVRTEPKLLPLFPVTSPRLSGSSDQNNDSNASSSSDK